MSRLVLVRHGRTAWNSDGRAQGHTDVELDEVGRAQATALAPVLAAMAPSRLFSSDLARARQTAEQIGAAAGLEVRTDPRLREFDVGERAGLTVAEFEQRYPVPYAAWKAGHITGDVPGAESEDQVVARMLPALTEILDSLGARETTIVVAHGACLKVTLPALLGWPDGVGATLRGLDNCGWVVLEQEENARGLRLVSYNATVAPAGPRDPDDEGTLLG